MNYIVYICYPLLGALLMWRARVYGRKEWNEEFMSLSQTKALQGFCAVCVILHHIGQKTCAPWLEPEVIVHGLDIFVPIGYFLVGIFLFCSGYGLYKSYKGKANYLQGFFGRRFTIPLMVLVSVNFFFVFVRYQQEDVVSLSTPFHVSGPQMANGYAWFVYVLLLFYLIFYLAFRFCKKEKTAVFFIGLAAFLYMIHCDWWMYGNWWYNSVILFVVGLLFARHEKRVVAVVKKRYPTCLVAVIVLTTCFFVVSEYAQQMADMLGITYIYAVGRWVILSSQMLAACGFAGFVCLLGMKVKIGNRALGFLGSMTLEIYMLHCLFLQIFGYKENLPKQFYVKNVALLVLVVLVCTIITAYLIHKFYGWLVKFMMKQEELRKAVKKDMKKIMCGAVILLLVMTVGMSISSHRKSIAMEEKLETYIQENITYADVDGKRMAAYIAGEGEHTIVLLRGLYDPCPTITLRPLADDLAKNNRVIILDYLGSGFSDDTERERTADRFVDEIHTALVSLGETGPYILAAHQLSGLYVQLYAEQYPDEVEAIIGLDSSVAAQPDEMLALSNLTADEYRRRLEKQGKVQNIVQQILKTTGYARLQWGLYEPIFQYRHNEEETEIIQEMFIRRAYSADIADEIKHEYDAHQQLLGKKYKPDVPVLFLLAYYSCEGPVYAGSDWLQLHEDLCTNKEIQKMIIMNGNSSFVYLKQDELEKRIQDFIEELDSEK